jgi:hypothetical protein
MTGWGALIVHDEAAKIVKLAEGAFYNLAFGDGHEATSSAQQPTRHPLLSAQAVDLPGKTALTGPVSTTAARVEVHLALAPVHALMRV